MIIQPAAALHIDRDRAVLHIDRDRAGLHIDRDRAVRAPQSVMHHDKAKGIG